MKRERADEQRIVELRETDHLAVLEREAGAQARPAQIQRLHGGGLDDDLQRRPFALQPQRSFENDTAKLDPLAGRGCAQSGDVEVAFDRHARQGPAVRQFAICGIGRQAHWFSGAQVAIGP